MKREIEKDILRENSSQVPDKKANEPRKFT